MTPADLSLDTLGALYADLLATVRRNRAARLAGQAKQAYDADRPSEPPAKPPVETNQAVCG